MGFLIFLGSVAVIVLWYFIAKEFQRIAQMKGHDEQRYFWWTFLMGPVGMMMVIALPDHFGAEGAVSISNDELPDL